MIVELGDMPKNTAEIRVGRLLEIRADAGHRTGADDDDSSDMVPREMAKLPRTQRVVVVVDWRRCPLMDAAGAERVLQRIAANNARTERSAVLISKDSPVSVLQFTRVIRESGHAERRVFFDPDELSAWLREVLSEPEFERLQQFLAR